MNDRMRVFNLNDLIVQSDIYDDAVTKNFLETLIETGPDYGAFLRKANTETNIQDRIILKKLPILHLASRSLKGNMRKLM